MAIFIDFIFQLFKKYGYKELGQIAEGNFLFKHNLKCDYWLVAANIYSFEKQQELFSVIAKECKSVYPHADKNTSMLLLIERTGDSEEHQESEFVTIENDPFYFKKYVLPFDVTSFRQLTEHINGSCDNVEKYIMKNDVFEDLRKGEGYARLLYTIIHKLPFIPIILEGSKEIDNTISYSSEAITDLDKCLDTYPVTDTEENQNKFVDDLIKKYEDETD